MGMVAFTEERTARRGTARRLLVYRALDVSIALLVLLCTAPLLLALCALIRLDSAGPAIFRQRRLGRDRRPFTVHKLRTMRMQCDDGIHREYIEQLLCGREQTHAGADGRDLYKLAADDRVTRVGRVLRKTSLDELPQILDVLRGHMSLVGPRPVIPYEAELYPPEYERRFDVKPGITGLWQVNGRNERTYKEMVELDIVWAERHSVGLYLSILLRTPLVLLARRGAA
jgi:lipopolysaccharide/colanic/teichoic acid biosynthesis glycosyltransferase